MSTTTEILFNSPALHSLKREQLVKLCKIHSIKASGKNVDLIQKLRLHARTLPKDSPLSIAARSEEHGPIPMQLQSVTTDTEGQEEEEEMRDDASYQSSRPPRPSEQWEMVMDSIDEEEEEGSSQGTLTSMRTASNGGGTGEFGTGGSRSTTVSSSIKAIATSLGLKRGNSNTKFTPASSSTSTTTSSSMKTTAAFPSHPVQEATDDELSQMSTPYSSLPESTSLPQTDHFTLTDTRMSIGGTTEVPLPGTVLRPGVPAPANARLSMGLNGPTTPTRPTTTIRLISNPLSNLDSSSNTMDHSYGYGMAGENGTPQLKPFSTTFDITFGSPAPLGGGGGPFNFGSLSTWPPRSEEEDGDGDDVRMGGIYPKLSFSDLPPSIEPKQPGTPAKPGDVSVSVHPNPTSSHPSSLAVPNSPSLFVFGTPHKVTDDQFRSAAASVLEDLNRQLREDGVEEIDNDIIAKLHPGSSKALQTREIKPIPASKRGAGDITEKFQKMHEEEFQKMEGIDSIVRRRDARLRRAVNDDDGEKVVVGKKRKSSVIARESGAPRRPSGFAPRRASNTRVISTGRRAKAIPGAFGDDDDDDDNDDNDANDADADRGGKRVRMDPESSASTSQTPEEEQKEVEEREKKRVELEREKEAIRKKLEANRTRRRSSAAHAHGAGGLSGGRKSGRVSVGRPRPSVLVKAKPKPSRFGFLSSAKSLVQSVWNRGKAPAASTTAGPSQIPKPMSTATATTTKPEPAKMGPPMLISKKRASIAPARPTHLVASGSRVPSSSLKVNDPNSKQSVTSTTRVSVASSSTRSRSPLPSIFTGTAASSSRNSFQSNAGTRTSATTTRSRTTSTNVSSIGTRLSSATRVSNIGSMGTKNSGVGTRSSVASRSSAGMGAGTTSSRTSSRLYAPTASSLAKMARLPPLGGHTGATHAQKQASALGSITNSPTVVAPSHTQSHSHTHSPAMSHTSTLFSPKQGGGIFSKPLLLPTQSGIPTPVKRRTGNVNLNEGADLNVNDTPRSREDQAQAKPSTFVRTHSLNGRKPRISRSKVIARLASQREAGGSGSRNANASGSGSGGVSRTSAIAPRKSSGKTRSSLGAKVSGSRVSSGGGVVMSAKKRARQSEYARRRSKVGSPALEGAKAVADDVDMD